jgi:tetrahydromethanopterin S-methyltransferase subunit H
MSKWPFVSGDYVVINEKAAIAIVTCGSYDLPKELAKLSDKIAIVGFCETENSGIAKILQNLASNPNIRFLIVCGERVVGHEPGQTIISLYNNGIDENYRIIGSEGTIPVLHPNYFRGDDPNKFVKRFQRQIVRVVDAQGETNVQKLMSIINELNAQNISPFPEEPILPLTLKVEYDWGEGMRRFQEENKSFLDKGISLLNPLIFTGELRVYDICGIKIGGQRGEYPVVLAGTMFYRGDKLVVNHSEGVFDKIKAEEQIRKQEENSLKYEIPSMVHIVGETSEALTRYLLFVVDITDSPIILDSPVLEARIEAMGVAKDLGLDGRVIYNSVSGVDKREKAMIGEMGGIEYSIVLPFDVKLPSRINRFREIIEFMEGLITKPIIDPGVSILGAGSISALHAAWLFKNCYGYPVCIGIHNLQSRLSKSNSELKNLDFSFDYALPSLYGIDINLYGPIKNAEAIFREVAAVEAAIADENINTVGIYPKPPHPYYALKLGCE